MFDDKAGFEKTLVLKVGKHEDIPFKAESSDGSFLFEITTQQDRPDNDDIIVKIVDEKNHQILLNNDKAIRAGANSNLLEVTETLVQAKAYWNTTLFFKPIKGEQYYLVLDNSHSFNKDKTVEVKIYFEPDQAEPLGYIKNSLKNYGWSDLLERYMTAQRLLKEKDYASACDNARKTIVLLWSRVCEKITGEKIQVTEGRGFISKELEEVLKSHNTSNHVVSFISRSWALVSELAHIEKTDGKQPNEESARLALNVTASVLSFLLLFLQKNTSN